jgi:outer membrane protein, heavy metal efflux system
MLLRCILRALTPNRKGIVIALVVLTTASASRAAGQQPPAMKITLDDAIRLAIAHNHSLRAAQSLIEQSQAEEITAGLRPNPVFTYDDLFVPIKPGDFTGSNLNSITEFDVGASFTWERGHKRQARVAAARDQTAVTRSQVSDTERSLTFNVAQQFVSALLAKSQLDFAQQDLASFEQTSATSEERYKAGAISEGDLLKIKLQLLQFQTDVSSAKLALVQALASLRELMGYDAVPENYDVAGDLSYSPIHANKEDLQLLALKQRPDLLAAQQGVTAAQSQYGLAKANGKRNLTTTWYYTHVSAIDSASFIMNMEIPIFDRNQGEIARTHYAITQADEQRRAAEEVVMTDVTTAFETLRTSEKVVQLYDSGYRDQAKQSLDISQYAYKRGAVSLLDFLDAERSYRSTELAYRQALANYMLSLEQLREAVGTRNLP